MRLKPDSTSRPPTVIHHLSFPHQRDTEYDGMYVFTTHFRTNFDPARPFEACAIIPAMSEPVPPRAPVRPITPLKTTARADDTVLCERCGKAEMYRMHAVWRCPECGFKTDCCGW
jgi:hypothetical protein